MSTIETSSVGIAVTLPYQFKTDTVREETITMIKKALDKLTSDPTKDIVFYFLSEKEEPESEKLIMDLYPNCRYLRIIPNFSQYGDKAYKRRNKALLSRSDVLLVVTDESLEPKQKSQEFLLNELEDFSVYAIRVFVNKQKESNNG